MPSELKPLVTVCNKCFQASCWQGIFMCQRAQNAGTVDMFIEDLMKMGLEHPDHWKQGIGGEPYDNGTGDSWPPLGD